MKDVRFHASNVRDSFDRINAEDWIRAQTKLDLEIRQAERIKKSGETFPNAESFRVQFMAWLEYLRTAFSVTCGLDKTTQ